MPPLYSLFYSKVQQSVVKTIANEKYTILDNDGYNQIICNATTSGTIMLPTLADNQNRFITVINQTSGLINIFPEGTDKINSWNAPILLNQQWGQWQFQGTSGQWIGKTEGNSTILYTGSTSASTLDTTYNVWSDASITLSLTPGKYLLDFEVSHYLYLSSPSQYFKGAVGIGTQSGNYEPNIWVSGNDILDWDTGSYNYYCIRTRLGKEIQYTTSTNVTVYLKGYHNNGSNITAHQLNSLGTTSLKPYFIRARRIA